MMAKKLCNECRPLFEESYLASARQVLKDGERLLLENKVIKAAKVLFAGYTAEDQAPDLWHTDDQLDYRLRRLFAQVEALLEVKE